MPERPRLTEAELRIMEAVWKLKRATVAEVAETLPQSLGLAYNTVLTTMRILEGKGYLRHGQAKQGRAFVYRATLTRETASRNAVRHLLRRFFGNSREALLLNLLEEEPLSETEMQRIREVLKRK